MKLVFVSTGNPMMARDFAESMRLSAPIWVDKTLATYRHLGFKRGLWSTLLSPKAIANTLRAWKLGFRQKRVLGDPWQQGGVVVVKRGGEAVYAFASEVAGDHPPTAEVLEAAGLEKAA